MQCEHEFKLFHTRYGVGEWCVKCKATRAEADVDTKKQTLDYRIVDDPNGARVCGFDKRFKRVEFFCVGKWRLVGYFTLVQIRKGMHLIAMADKLVKNTGWYGKPVFVDVTEESV